MNRLKTILFLFAAVFGLTASAQDSAMAVLQRGAGDFLPLYCGRQEPGYKVGYANTPYWPQEFTTGKIVYGGIAYDSVPLSIDTYRQQLLVQTTDGRLTMEARHADVERLEIGGVEYVWLGKADGAPTAAFYAVMMRQPETVYCLHIAPKFVKSIDDQTRRIQRTFTWNERYYLMKGGKWKKISKKAYKKLVEKGKQS